MKFTKIENRTTVTVLGIFAALFFLIVFIDKYPVYYASNHIPKGYFFSGQASWFDPWDVNVYVAVIKNGQQGHLLLSNLYTSISNKPVLFYPLYTGIGFLFKQVDSFILFHFFSIITTFILCGGIFFLSYLLLHDVWYSLFSVAIIIAGNGFGWFYDLGILSADSTFTSFTFSSAIQRPHEAIGIFLYIASMVFFLKYILTSNTKYNVFSLLSLLFLIVFYPYYLPLFFFVFALYLVLMNKQNNSLLWKKLFFNCFIVGLFTVVYFIYLQSSAFATVTSQTLTKIQPLSILLGYGLFFLVYLKSFCKAKCSFSLRIFLMIWITLGILFSLFPFFGFSRFYLRGLFYPIAILVFLEIKNLLKQENRSLVFIICVILLIFGLITPAFIFSKRLNEVHQNNSWYYLPLEYKSAFDYLKKSSRDGILAHPTLSNYIPAFTGKKVYAGHTLQTPDYENKINQARSFYENKYSRADSYNFLKKNNIHYVLISDFEKNWGPKLEKYTFLKKIYQNKRIAIYQVE